MRRKILFIVPCLSGGGVQRLLILILRHLNRDRFEPIVAVLESINDYKDEIPPDVKVVYLNKRGPFDNPRMLYLVTRIIAEEAPQAICSFMYPQNYLAILARGLSGKKVPVVTTDHSILSLATRHDRFGSAKRLLIRKLYPHADFHICVSNGIRKDLVSHYSVSDRKCAVIYNAVELERVRQLARAEPDGMGLHEIKPYFIACGRLSEEKNYPLLLRSFLGVLRIRSARLLILGEGKLKNELLSLARELGITDNVRFLGFQVNPFMYMARAVALVLPSSWEGFGNVLIEAMASGIPVISTDCPSGPSEIITDGLNGLLVPVDDEGALTKAMLKVLNDSDMRVRLVHEAMKRVELYRVQNVVAEYERIFSAVMGDQHANG